VEPVEEDQVGVEVRQWDRLEWVLKGLGRRERHASCTVQDVKRLKRLNDLAFPFCCVSILRRGVRGSFSRSVRLGSVLKLCAYC
jgi:hypothetical protein